ncbi:hypothetical protein UlMin_023244 [Ulmus minor]
MMLRLGFADSWVKLIMRCVRSVSYSFLINRQVTGAVIPHRCLRQGDPLSPYLFVICAHGLSEMLACSEERKLFTGIKIASGCPSISHLFFADDSLIFCKAKLSEATHLKSCLNSYAKASGQLINFDKSAFSFSPNTRIWRFIQRPNSLLYRVFKAKYFHSSTIWHASANSKASYVWKSILWGRNLVAKGIRWRVGDGRSISVYNSRWIPTPHSFMVNSPKTLPADSLVSELLDNACRWNIQLIRDSFLDFEAEKILQIPRSSLNLADSYCWHFNNKGLYSVRSAYKLALHTDIHHVPTNLKCSLCGSGIETTIHSLFLCPKVKFIWKKSGMVDCLSAARSGNMVDVAFWAKDNLSSEYFELFAMYTWEVWNLRNSWTHGKEVVIKGNELRWIPEYLSSFKACRATMLSLPSSPQPRLDVDAAFDADTKCFGLGAVIQDNRGSLIVAGVWPGQQASSVGMAELLAVKAGLQMAKDYEQSSLIVYCDAINEVAKL